MTEKQHLPATERKPVPMKDVDVEIIGGVTTLPLRKLVPPRTQQETSSDEGLESSEEFEDALDKASRLIQGKYAGVLPNTEEFIRQRREEAEAEDRQP